MISHLQKSSFKKWEKKLTYVSFALTCTLHIYVLVKTNIFPFFLLYAAKWVAIFAERLKSGEGGWLLKITPSGQIPPHMGKKIQPFLAYTYIPKLKFLSFSLSNAEGALSIVPSRDFQSQSQPYTHIAFGSTSIWDRIWLWTFPLTKYL